VTSFPHIYYIIRILRRLTAKQNFETRDVILRIFQLNALQIIWIFARLTSINADKEEKKDREKSKIRKIGVSVIEFCPIWFIPCLASILARST
jgi:hypothetical protein